MHSLRLYSSHIVLFSSILLLDQWTKWYAHLVQINVPLAPYLRFLYVENRGIAFSLPLRGLPLQIVTVCLILLIVGAIFHYRVYEKKLLFLFLVMILAGAVGNAIDRLTLGYVVDFISVGSFPVFNIADSFVCIGGAGVVGYLWWKERRG